MTTASECFFVPIPACDAYWAWKSRLGLPDTTRSGPRNLTLIDDRVDQEVKWKSRWGVLTVEGRADFIPVQGGCVLYVEFASAGFLPGLLLRVKRPVGRYFEGMFDPGAVNRKGLRRLLPRRAGKGSTARSDELTSA